VVYYFHAALHVMRATGAGRVRFSVPTGNFGDIFAGYVAARMGLPIARLILATNENDILARFFREGEYRLGRVMPTLSPSMDIQVASNFERYLYYRVGEDPARLSALMEDFAATGTLHLDDGARAERDGRFEAGVGDTQATLDTIRMFADRYDYLLDPHSAVGVHVGLEHLDDDEPTICLATAHPAKFPDAVRRALGRDAAHHPVIDELQHLPTRCDTLDADPATVRRYIERRALHPESRNPQPNTRDQPRGTTIHDHETA